MGDIMVDLIFGVAAFSLLEWPVQRGLKYIFSSAEEEKTVKSDQTMSLIGRGASMLVDSKEKEIETDR